MQTRIPVLGIVIIAQRVDHLPVGEAAHHCHTSEPGLPSVRYSEESRYELLRPAAAAGLSLGGRSRAVLLLFPALSL